MPSLYNNSYFEKPISILKKYLVFKVNETFHPICTVYFIVADKSPDTHICARARKYICIYTLDNKYILLLRQKFCGLKF